MKKKLNTNNKVSTIINGLKYYKKQRRDLQDNLANSVRRLRIKLTVTIKLYYFFLSESKLRKKVKKKKRKELTI